MFKKPISSSNEVGFFSTVAVSSEDRRWYEPCLFIKAWGPEEKRTASVPLESPSSPAGSQVTAGDAAPAMVWWVTVAETLMHPSIYKAQPFSLTWELDGSGNNRCPKAAEMRRLPKCLRSYLTTSSKLEGHVLRRAVGTCWPGLCGYKGQVWDGISGQLYSDNISLFSQVGMGCFFIKMLALATGKTQVHLVSPPGWLATMLASHTGGESQDTFQIKRAVNYRKLPWSICFRERGTGHPWQARCKYMSLLWAGKHLLGFPTLTHVPWRTELSLPQTCPALAMQPSALTCWLLLWELGRQVHKQVCTKSLDFLLLKQLQKGTATL